MSTDLVTLDFTNLPSTQLGTDDQFDALSKGTAFLGRLQLYTKGKDIDLGHIPPGHFGIPETDTKIINLGKEIDVLPFARRPKALDLGTPGSIVQSYDPESETFQSIKLKSEGSESKCMWGTSFLVLERATGRLLEFFMGSKSTRPIAGDLAVFCPLNQAQIDAKAKAGQDVSKLEPHGPLPVTLKVRLAKNKAGNTWHVPEVHPCSMAFSNVPAKAVMEELEKFLNPKNQGGEEVKEPEGKKGRAR
jgi:hypothetical protein